MTDRRDPEADDLYLDRLLDEQLGASVSPDLAARVVAADAATTARALARVAASDAQFGEQGAALPRRRWLALAAGVLLFAGALTFARRGTPPVDRAQALLDEFHRVMPSEPPQLRSLLCRERVAPRALPLLRQMTAWLDGHCDDPLLGARAAEFTVYALVLDEPDTRARTTAAATAGSASAELLLATAATIVAASDADRAAALAQVESHLRHPVAEAPSAVQCLLTAADLSAAEAARLAAATRDATLAQRLRIGGELAVYDARRLLGKPFEVSGRVLTGAEFSTTSLHGKVVLVFFWASWCAPCSAALPEIAAVAERYRARGLEVVGVSCDHDSGELRAFLAAHPEVSWPQLFDVRQPGWHSLAFWCGVRTVPRSFLIDRRGVLREIYTRGDLDRLIRGLLDE